MVFRIDAVERCLSATGLVYARPVVGPTRALPELSLPHEQGCAAAGRLGTTSTCRIYYLRTESNYHSPPRAGVHDPGLNWVVDVEYMDRAQGPTK